jgi:NADPH-dependent 2,4-dienoyl-CoA reductase/sulfur reductase-like enzyme
MPDELNSIARKMIAEAKIQDCPGAYSATGHSTNNISIIHQQVRCINLAWALVKLRKVKHGSVVGIVGGGFSGLMLAVSLAIQRRCIVYIYEKDPRPLQRFRHSPYRYISTNLNSRDLPPRLNLKYSRPIYDLPIFAWNYGTASEVAHRWLREFQDYYVRLPSASHRW